MIFRPEGVVVTGWASAASDITMTPVAARESAAATAARRDKTRIVVCSYESARLRRILDDERRNDWEVLHGGRITCPDGAGVGSLRFVIAGLDPAIHAVGMHSE
jgi:hypothetical protein